MKVKRILALNLFWAVLAICAFFCGSMVTKSRMSGGGEDEMKIGISKLGNDMVIGQGIAEGRPPSRGQVLEHLKLSRAKPVENSAPLEKYTKRVVSLSSHDFAKLVKTDLDEAKIVYALVDDKVTRQTFGSIIVGDILTRDLDAALAYSDQEVIWWVTSIGTLATAVDEQRGTDGLLAWIDGFEYSDDESDRMQYKQIAARTAVEIVARNNPQRARNWVIANAGQSHVDGYTLQKIAGNVADDLDLQLKWLADLPISGKDQGEGIAGLFAGFIRSDLEAANQWLAKQDLKPMHDRAIQEFVNEAAILDYEGARTWAKQINDETLRTESLQRAKLRWLNKP